MLPWVSVFVGLQRNIETLDEGEEDEEKK